MGPFKNVHEALDMRSCTAFIVFIYYLQGKPEIITIGF